MIAYITSRMFINAHQKGASCVAVVVGLRHSVGVARHSEKV